ncbi:MAG: phage tail tube protein, partial [Planctomycetia bacterium]
MPLTAGWQRYLCLARESAWGEEPAAPQRLHLPLTAYTVRARPRGVQAALFVGERRRRHFRLVDAVVAGALECPLFGVHAGGKSLAQHLLDWGLSGADALTGDSYQAELFENGNDDKVHRGLRAASWRLTGEAGGPVTLSMALQGRLEAAGAAPPPPTGQPYPVEFLFSDASCTIGGQPIELRGFRLTLDNKLQVNRAAGYWPAHLTHGVREVGLTLAVYKTAATYDALRRSAALATTAVQLTLKGRHLGTAADAFTRVVLTLPAARLADATDAERQR